jgi:hypothetical protein
MGQATPRGNTLAQLVVQPVLIVTSLNKLQKLAILSLIPMNETPDPCNSPAGFFGSVYQAYSLHWWLTNVIPWAALIFFLFCIRYAWKADPENGLKRQMAFYFAFWVIAPPAWFMIEYFLLAPTANPMPCPETFKYAQDVTAKAWVALVALLIGAYTKKPGVA